MFYKAGVMAKNPMSNLTAQLPKRVFEVGAEKSTRSARREVGRK